MEEINIPKQLAFRFLQNTSCNIFLTGKAGTGKTTFLRELREQQLKRVVVTAPTGVAAMNAQGVTLHSLFQLPFTPYIPGREVLKNNKYNRTKINLIRSIDILVIDEISMVRADTLDAVSAILRRYRNPRLPFGGVQLLLIGDLQQLAPVVKDEEWAILSQYYKTPFFFDSLEFKQTPYYPIELTHIYRQSDTDFVNILNAIRDNKITPDTLARLNERYQERFSMPKDQGFITLTTHNAQAQRINREEMERIAQPEYAFDAVIDRDFPEYLYPTDFRLELKKGAQVMFIQNDPSPDKKYYNGRIGMVEQVSDNSVTVLCDDDLIIVAKGEWQNIKYTINEQTQEIEEKVEGIFRQYPLRQAYAITIHKSQGLTFDNVIIDAAQAFAHGQVYVALSRCRTLEGIVLRSRISPQALINDTRVDNYIVSLQTLKPTEIELNLSQRDNYYGILRELFDFNQMIVLASQVAKVFYMSLKSSFPQLTERWCLMKDELKMQTEDVSDKFQRQLKSLIFTTDSYEQDEHIQERICKGASYFSTQLEQLLLPLTMLSLPETDNKEAAKQLKLQMDELLKEQDLKLALLSLVQRPFTITDYFRMRSRMQMERPSTPKERSKSTVSAIDYDEIKHKALYDKVREWRNEEASSLNLPVYTILQQKAMIGVANTLPTCKKELLAIHGIGKRVVEKYGVKLLELVDDYRLYSNNNDNSNGKG